LLLRSLKIAHVPEVQNIKTPIGKRDTATRSAQLNTEFSGSFSRYDLGAHAFRTASLISLPVTEAVPRFITTRPPAQFAIMAACRKLAPAPNASV
jgi:hypothetical protein